MSVTISQKNVTSIGVELRCLIENIDPTIINYLEVVFTDVALASGGRGTSSSSSAINSIFKQKVYLDRNEVDSNFVISGLIPDTTYKVIGFIHLIGSANIIGSNTLSVRTLASIETPFIVNYGSIGLGGQIDLHINKFAMDESLTKFSIVYGYQNIMKMENFEISPDMFVDPSNNLEETFTVRFPSGPEPIPIPDDVLVEVSTFNSRQGEDSEMSNTMIVETRPKPNSVTDLAATWGNTTVDLTWSAPYSPGDFPILSYVLQAFIVGDDDLQIVDETSPAASYEYIVDGTSALAHTFTGLTNGTTHYLIRIKSVNANGSSGYSSVNGWPYTTSNAVGNLSYAASDRTLTFSWNAPSAPLSTGGFDISGYRCSFNGGESFDLRSTETSTVVTGLRNGSAYSFSVIPLTTNKNDNSILEGASASIDEAYPFKTSAAVDTLTYTAADQSITCSWTAPIDTGNRPIVSYRLSVNGGAHFDVSANVLYHTFTTLSDGTALVNDGTEYSFSVVAITHNISANTDVEGAWSTLTGMKTFGDDLFSNSSLTYVAGDGSIEYTFTFNPSMANGNKPVRFVVTSGDNEIQRFNYDSTATSYSGSHSVSNGVSTPISVKFIHINPNHLDAACTSADKTEEKDGDVVSINAIAFGANHFSNSSLKYTAGDGSIDYHFTFVPITMGNGTEPVRFIVRSGTAEIQRFAPSTGVTDPLTGVITYSGTYSGLSNGTAYPISVQYVHINPNHNDLKCTNANKEVETEGESVSITATPFGANHFSTSSLKYTVEDGRINYHFNFNPLTMANGTKPLQFIVRSGATEIHRFDYSASTTDYSASYSVKNGDSTPISVTYRFIDPNHLDLACEDDNKTVETEGESVSITATAFGDDLFSKSSLTYTAENELIHFYFTFDPLTMANGTKPIKFVASRYIASSGTNEIYDIYYVENKTDYDGSFNVINGVHNPISVKYIYKNPNYLDSNCEDDNLTVEKNGDVLSIEAISFGDDLFSNSSLTYTAENELIKFKFTFDDGMANGTEPVKFVVTSGANEINTFDPSDGVTDPLTGVKTYSGTYAGSNGTSISISVKYIYKNPNYGDLACTSADKAIEKDGDSVSITAIPFGANHFSNSSLTYTAGDGSIDYTFTFDPLTMANGTEPVRFVVTSGNDEINRIDYVKGTTEYKRTYSGRTNGTSYPIKVKYIYKNPNYGDLDCTSDDKAIEKDGESVSISAIPFGANNFSTSSLTYVASDSSIEYTFTFDPLTMANGTEPVRFIVSSGNDEINRIDYVKGTTEYKRTYSGLTNGTSYPIKVKYIYKNPNYGDLACTSADKTVEKEGEYVDVSAIPFGANHFSKSDLRFTTGSGLINYSFTFINDRNSLDDMGNGTKPVRFIVSSGDYEIARHSYVEGTTKYEGTYSGLENGVLKLIKVIYIYKNPNYSDLACTSADKTVETEGEYVDVSAIPFGQDTFPTSTLTLTPGNTSLGYFFNWLDSMKNGTVPVPADDPTNYAFVATTSDSTNTYTLQNVFSPGAPSYSETFTNLANGTLYPVLVKYFFYNPNKGNLKCDDPNRDSVQNTSSITASATPFTDPSPPPASTDPNFDPNAPVAPPAPGDSITSLTVENLPSEDPATYRFIGGRLKIRWPAFSSGGFPISLYNVYIRLHSDANNNDNYVLVRSQPPSIVYTEEISAAQAAADEAAAQAAAARTVANTDANAATIAANKLSAANNDVATKLTQYNIAKGEYESAVVYSNNNPLNGEAYALMLQDEDYMNYTRDVYQTAVSNSVTAAAEASAAASAAAVSAAAAVAAEAVAAAAAASFTAAVEAAAVEAAANGVVNEYIHQGLYIGNAHDVKVTATYTDANTGAVVETSLSTAATVKNTMVFDVPIKPHYVSIDLSGNITPSWKHREYSSEGQYSWDEVNNKSSFPNVNKTEKYKIIPSPLITQDADVPKYDLSKGQGWYFKNTGISGNKVNWYLVPPPKITINDVNNLAIQAKLISKGSLPFITIYTKRKGDGLDISSWYRSRHTYTYQASTTNLATDMDYNLQVALNGSNLMTLPGATGLTLTQSSSSIISTAALPSDEVMLLSIGTDSGASAGRIEMVLKSLILITKGTDARSYGFGWDDHQGCVPESFDVKLDSGANVNLLYSSVAGIAGEKTFSNEFAVSDYNNHKVSIVSKATRPYPNGPVFSSPIFTSGDVYKYDKSGEVSDLTRSMTNDAGAVLTWGVPGSLNGGTFLPGELKAYSSTDGGNTYILNDVIITGTIYDPIVYTSQFASLTNGINYRFKVSGKVQNIRYWISQNGDVSTTQVTNDITDDTIDGIAHEIATAPQNVTMIEDDKQLTVTFENSASGKGLDITSYVLTDVTDSTHPVQVDTFTYSSTATSYSKTITGLTNGVQKFYEITPYTTYFGATTDSSGNSIDVDIEGTSASISGIPSGYPIIQSIEVNNTSSTQKTVTVNFNPNGSPVTSIVEILDPSTPTSTDEVIKTQQFTIADNSDTSVFENANATYNGNYKFVKTWYTTGSNKNLSGNIDNAIVIFSNKHGCDVADANGSFNYDTPASVNPVV